jgi:tripartite-type tricarboxylate transporter receptor subunit TctC
MRSLRGRVALALSLLALHAMASRTVHAQGFPDRPIRLVVPFPAAGAADVLARATGQKLAEAWNQQVVVDNRPGAAAVIGSDLVAKAAPNGYTLLMGATSSHAIGPNINRVPYDPVKDFAPVTMVAFSPFALVVVPTLPVKSVQELIDHAKSRPARLNMGSFGSGSASHLFGELFKAGAAIDMVHVPYKGSPPALIDLIGGQIQVMFDNLSSVLPHVRSGKLRALAITSAKRSRAAPELPPLADTLPGYEAIGWFGVFAPAGTPTRIVSSLNSGFVLALSLPDVRQLLADQGLEAVGNSPEQFAQIIRQDLAKWAKVVKDSGARFD